MLILVLREMKDRLGNKIEVEDTITTFNTIIQEKKSVARFGDGEFNLLLNENLKFQKCNPRLNRKLQDVLLDKSNNSNCLICIPYVLSSLKDFTLKSRIFWIKYLAQNRNLIVGLLSNDIKYYDAQITRFYINRSDKSKSEIYLQKWKEIWNNRTILLVEGSESRLGIGNTLFDNSKEVKRIICPSKNAFVKYDEIYTSIVNTKGYDVCLIALGPTATVLAYELSKEGVWAIDTGNMDMEYEWMLRGVRKQVAVKGKYTLEAQNGTLVDECLDRDYRSQIIEVIV